MADLEGSDEENLEMFCEMVKSTTPHAATSYDHGEKVIGKAFDKAITTFEMMLKEILEEEDDDSSSSSNDDIEDDDDGLTCEMESLTSISSNICEDMKLLEQSYQKPVSGMGRPEDTKAEDQIPLNEMGRPIDAMVRASAIERCVDLFDDEMKRRNDATLIKPRDSKFFQPCLGWPPWEVIMWIFRCTMQLAIQSQQLGSVSQILPLMKSVMCRNCFPWIRRLPV